MPAGPSCRWSCKRWSTAANGSPSPGSRPTGPSATARGTIGRIAADTLTMGAGQVIPFSGQCTGRSATLGSPLSPALKMVVSYDERDAFNEVGGAGARITVAR